jgi:replicative DNA helicase
VCERWRRAGIKPGLIAIDYLGLVRTSDRYRGNKVNEQGEIALGGKLMAGQLETCVLLLAQLNRGVESRDDKRPVMSDLRASGEIEEHADVVGLLYRPNYYDQRSTEVRNSDPAALDRMDRRKYDLDLGLDKNRLGPTMAVRLWCDVGRSAVDNARRDY